MRKMMMAALFSVVSLSACAVQDPGEPEPDDVAVETATAQPPAHAPHSRLDGDAVELTRAKPLSQGINTQEIDEESAACEVNEDCASNVCNQEDHLCHMYPY